MAGEPPVPPAEPFAAPRVFLGGRGARWGVSGPRWGNFSSPVYFFAAVGAPPRPGGVCGLQPGGAGGVFGGEEEVEKENRIKIRIFYFLYVLPC